MHDKLLSDAVLRVKLLMQYMLNMGLCICKPQLKSLLTGIWAAVPGAEILQVFQTPAHG